MSLRVDYKGIADFEIVCYDGDGNVRPATQILQFATMALDLGRISEANAGEFYARLNLWQKYVSPMWTKGDGTPLYATAEDVVAHIGLSTNVRDYTRHQWFSRMISPELQGDVNRVKELLGQEVV